MCLFRRNNRKKENANLSEKEDKNMIVETDSLRNRPLYQSYYTGITNVYAGEYPGDKYGEKAETKIRQMHHFGVRHFIDLTEEGELNPYAHLLPADCSHTRFPIRDVSVPDSLDEVYRLIGKIMELSKRDDGYVYIHCWGGVGRTGTIVGCLLAEDMETPTFDAVIKKLRCQFSEMPKSAHRVTPETKEQETFIKKYIEGTVARRKQCKERVRDRVRGSLMAGAAGDALGYPVEFMSKNAILSQYGGKGITQFELDRIGTAVVSDDTQMTLFTANGLLFGVTRFCTHGVLGAGLKDYVAYAYQDWLQTQIGVEDYHAYHYCWIRDIKELNVRRAPGNTCLSALMSIKHHQEVNNDSKGCGGVMRVAPVGLMAAADQLVMVKDWHGKDVPRREWTGKEVARLGGDCAEITHKHPLGYLPAAFMADLVYYILMYDGPITFSIIEKILGAVYADVKSGYTTLRELKALDALWRLIEKAVSQAGDVTVPEELAITRLGEGWTGDEALAIAIYCTMKHLDSIEDALTAAVNHNGDSDSTGAITGNIMGAIYGYEAIKKEHLFCPEGREFEGIIELSDIILALADDLFTGCVISEYDTVETSEKKQWEARYVYMRPAGITKKSKDSLILPL